MTERQGIAGAIIAGGQSSRMRDGGVQGDKFMQMLGTRPVIGHVAERLAPQVESLFINANGDPARLAALGVPVVADMKLHHGGPLAGILTALTHAADHPLLLTMAGDTPFLPADVADRLRERLEETGAQVVLTSSNGRVHPVCGLWRTGLRQRLAEWLQSAPKASVLAFATHIGFDTVEFPPVAIGDDSESFDPFFNINRPDDLAQARRLEEILR